MMKTKESIEKIVIAAMLCAVGILIPTFFPKIVIGAASFTLASHVAVYLAMFISPAVGIAVGLGTTLGFLISGLPIVVTLRALSHIIFIVIGALWLTKHRYTLTSVKSMVVYTALISLIHAAAEVVVVTFFYFGGGLTEANYAAGFFESVILLVGLGGFVHSMVDFAIAIAVWKPITKILRTPYSALMVKEH